ncbi:MAG: prenyltransferase/squalene oxidase repeat-containing protein [Verrucomicrobiota bacterium]|nr:prenyltransferase/squalene oxidase repeat-containing protein [Verrucomicrobiota bacterium]
MMPNHPTPQELEIALSRLRTALLAQAEPGFWVRGRLSSSALSTAVAVCALHQLSEQVDRPLVQSGLDWLCLHQNSDGGWGDTPQSPSNPSTTLLGWCALAAGKGAAITESERRAEQYLNAWLHTPLNGPTLARAILQAYGSDRTFSVPILTCCAIMGRLQADQPWRHVPQLPFELAALPHRFYRWIRLPVVSYALPALIAIGLVRHHHRPTWNLPLRRLRDCLAPRLLVDLAKLQPSNGGFLEAAPLTAFVAMSLAAAGFSKAPVTTQARAFLRSNRRADGSWPIDTNLATWLTTLSIQALAHPNGLDALPEPRRNDARSRLLQCQFKTVHPFTQAAPGGWGWTDLPGAVPDADDTAGALLALAALGPLDDPEVLSAARNGMAWLIGLQNRDGGIPTFCRGWGRLPFDRSCPDLTAHALRAWIRWQPHQPHDFQPQVLRAIEDAVASLLKAQAPNGYWLPLWFGCQSTSDQTNPTYGTARVLLALHAIPDPPPAVTHAIQRGRAWLQAAQCPDGAWGGGPGAEGTIEETALAISALARGPVCPELSKGIGWLIHNLPDPLAPEPAAIGLYFSKLWYSERAYPLIFATEALAAVTEFHSCTAKDQSIR